MARAQVNGTELFYHQLGDGADVVLIHGLAASHAFWFRTGAIALRRRRRVTVYDLRGHGRSAMPPIGYTSRNMVDDLSGLLDHIGIESAVLVGHSFGGHVALHFAAEHPERVRGVVLADTRIYALQPQQRVGDSPHRSSMEEMILRNGNIDAESEDHFGLRVLEEWADQRRIESREAGRRGFVPFERSGGSAKTAGQWVKLLNNTTARRDVRIGAGLTKEKIRATRAPMLAIYGEYSRCLPSCRVLQTIVPRCRTVIVPKGGHFHPLSRPRVFLGALWSFVKENELCMS